MPKNEVVKDAQFRVIEDLHGTKAVQDRRLTVRGIEHKTGGRYKNTLYAKCLSSVVGSNKEPVTVWVELVRLENPNLFEKMDTPKVLATSCAPCDSCSRPQRSDWRPGASPCGEPV